MDDARMSDMERQHAAYTAQRGILGLIRRLLILHAPKLLVLACLTASIADPGALGLSLVTGVVFAVVWVCTRHTPAGALAPVLYSWRVVRVVVVGLVAGVSSCWLLVQYATQVCWWGLCGYEVVKTCCSHHVFTVIMYSQHHIITTIHPPCMFHHHIHPVHTGGMDTHHASNTVYNVAPACGCHTPTTACCIECVGAVIAVQGMHAGVCHIADGCCCVRGGVVMLSRWCR